MKKKGLYFITNLFIYYIVYPYGNETPIPLDLEHAKQSLGTKRKVTIVLYLKNVKIKRNWCLYFRI